MDDIEELRSALEVDPTTGERDVNLDALLARLRDNRWKLLERQNDLSAELARANGTVRILDAKIAEAERQVSRAGQQDESADAAE